MQVLLPLGALLGGAVPATVPVGTFRTWLPSDRATIAFLSGGVAVQVAALPCPPHPQGDTACHWDGYNNQAQVTVRAPGLAPVTVTTDRQGGYVRIAIVRFGQGDRHPGVIVESQSGGSGGGMTAQLLVPGAHRYRIVPLEAPAGHPLEGEIADSPRDLSGDGHIDLMLRDGAFAHVFGCNACTPRPPRLFAVQHGRVVDESRDPALRPIFAADMARLAPLCLSRARYRNGACAAYVADAARAGRFQTAWAAMLRHYERGGDLWQPCDLSVASRCPKGYSAPFRSFPTSLRAFLIRTGDLSPNSSSARGGGRPKA